MLATFLLPAAFDELWACLPFYGGDVSWKMMLENSQIGLNECIKQISWPSFAISVFFHFGVRLSTQLIPQQILHVTSFCVNILLNPVQHKQATNLTAHKI